MSRSLAVFDVGSNTVKVTAARVESGRICEVHLDDAIITRLSAGLAVGGELDPKAVERTLAGLRSLVERLDQLGIHERSGVATAGLRRARDPKPFLDRVQTELGLTIRLINGSEEAELSFLGATQGEVKGEMVVLDLGGRSTELAVGSGQSGVRSRASLPLGCISLTETFLLHDPPEPRETEAMLRSAREGLAQGAPPAEHGHLVGVSGTILALAALDLGVDDAAKIRSAVHGHILSVATVERQLDHLRRRAAVDRRFGTVIPEGRADVIVAGAGLLLEVLRHYDAPAIRASIQGLRYGLLHRSTAPSRGDADLTTT